MLQARLWEELIEGGEFVEEGTLLHWSRAEDLSVVKCL